jgi:hypothetical protein
MDLSYTPGELAFRDMVCAFIAENYPQDLRRAPEHGGTLTKEKQLRWRRILGARGRSGPNWPWRLRLRK